MVLSGERATTREVTKEREICHISNRKSNCYSFFNDVQTNEIFLDLGGELQRHHSRRLLSPTSAQFGRCRFKSIVC